MTGLREVARAHRRCAWIGDRLVWLTDDDVSLSYCAVRREVTRHAGGRSVVVGDDPFVVLGEELDAGSTGAEWFGWFGYAARPDLPALPDADLPDAVWMRPSGARRIGGRVPEAPPWRGLRHTTPVPDRYVAAFDRVQEHLRAGDSYEVNLTHRIAVASDVDPVTAYLRLRGTNPAPYAGFVQHDLPGAEGWLLSSSPERFARIDTDGTIGTRPIKGTTPRGETEAADREAAEALATGAKYRAENLMIVDLLRNDLARVCEVGSVEVPELMAVESYAAVHQLVSTITGRLRPDVSTVRALRALFPSGSMTGAPKLRTMRIIGEVESTPRGTYAGAFGWIAADGSADLGVVIRSLTTAGTGRYTLGTGGGITVASDAAEEYAETRWKAERVLAALA
ncbi:MAG: aminodeoxychorismate synthase component I [Nocardioidaceae bacterium]|nr:aminodeoxychorismate synthase component I [Nocardioidaceae bacterium]